MDIKNNIKNYFITKLGKTVLTPLDDLVDQNLTDVVTTIGSFIIRSVRGKFQRSITFTIGVNYTDQWMEEALYGILYHYNNIKKSSRLEITNRNSDGSGMYYRLDDGTHNLKYRNFDILLIIQTQTPSSASGRVHPIKVYTIITYDLSPEFVKLFERDMINHRNSILRINSDSPTLNVYQDYHEGDGYTYWDKKLSVNKRPIRTIYIPYEQKKQLVDTINEFFSNKEYYRKHGITHNLKILLYGPPGTGKDSIARMIASEWNRNIYYVTGGKDNKFIPQALTDNDGSIHHPLLLISDIDKYPFLINEPNVDLDKNPDAKEEAIRHKQEFGSMLNALDGILSGEDRIIVMTTNHIDKFSETFLRPGRVDLMMHIDYVTPDVFRKYVFDFYGKELPDDIKLKSDELKISDMQKDIVFMKMNVDEFVEKYVK